MSEAPDPLEAELSALRPHDPSPALRRRVAERLADVPSARRQWPWRLAVAGGLAAACVAAILLWWGGDRPVEPKRTVVPPKKAPPIRVEDPGPTLLAFQRALARSPEELDELLDRQAAIAPQPGPDLGTIVAFTRSDSKLHALLGDD